jgi:hypothetical protein
LSEFPNGTAQSVSMRALADPGAFPSSDPGLQQAMQMHSAAQLARRADGCGLGVHGAIYL